MERKEKIGSREKRKMELRKGENEERETERRR